MSEPTLKMLVAVPKPLEDALTVAAAEAGITANQLLLQIAHEHFGLPFAPRGRGASKVEKPPEKVYEFKTRGAALDKSIKLDAPILAVVDGVKLRVNPSGRMRPVEENGE